MEGLVGNDNDDTVTDGGRRQEYSVAVSSAGLVPSVMDESEGCHTSGYIATTSHTTMLSQRQ